ncbi:putative reverse transcriptase domain-containing protein [Tanacetum coccineum]
MDNNRHSRGKMLVDRMWLELTRLGTIRGEVGHHTRDCRYATAISNMQRAPFGNQQGVICYECGRPGHVKRDYPQLRNHNHGNRVENKTGNRRVTTKLQQEHMPSVEDELTLIPMLSRMAKNHAFAMIVYDEKVICIPYGDKVLIIQSDDIDGRSKSKLNIISCTKTQKYIEKGCQVYLAQVMSKKEEDKSEEKRLEDVSIVRNYPEVFPEELPGQPPTRQVEF